MVQISILVTSLAEEPLPAACGIFKSPVTVDFKILTYMLQNYQFSFQKANQSMIKLLEQVTPSIKFDQNIF